MKLWLIKVGPDVQQPCHGYDCYQGFVVRADSESAARKIAQETGGGDETKLRGVRRLSESFFIGAFEYWTEPTVENVSFWTDPTKATCVELTSDGDPGIVIYDFLHG
jgi:hypothetical protein